MTDESDVTSADALAALALPDRVALAARDAFGARAASVIAADPWAVLVLPAVRPEQADAYARSRLGAEAAPHDARRQARLLAWLVGRAARDGHTMLPARVAAAALATYGITDEPSSIVSTVEASGLSAWPDGSLALRDLAAAEQTIADIVAGLSSGSGNGTDARPAHLLDAGVAALTGFPGADFDQAIGELAAAARERDLPVTLIAPTARAVRRLAGVAGPGTALTHGEAVNQLDGSPESPGLVVVGHAQALDVLRAAAVLEAAAGAACIVLAGDARALPSLDGPGSPFQDIVTSGIVPVHDVEPSPPPGDAVATLDALGRCVGAGMLPRVDPADKQVVIVPARDGEHTVRQVETLVTQSIPGTLGLDPDDIAVLTPASRGVAGVKSLNALLKAAVNPGPGALSGFDVGDRVVLIADAADVSVGPGDVGVVTGEADGALLVEIAGRSVTVPPPLRSRVRHARALTVARAATGWWPAVVLALPGESVGLLSRALLRTAIGTAGTHLSVVHGSGPAVAHAVATGSERARHRALPRLLGAARGVR